MKNLNLKLNSIVTALMVLAFQFGCASASYDFTSEPDGANVYYFDPVTSKRMLMGVTPLHYAKASIPNEKPFVLTVEKDGFAPVETPVAPNDGSKTFMHFRLKPDSKGIRQSDLELNGSIRQLFKAQQLIYEKKYQAAISELDSILTSRPNLVQALVFKGTAYYLLQDLNSAADIWRKALDIDPDNEQLLKFLKEKNIKL